MALAFIQVCLCPANLSVKTFPSRADYIAAVEKAANFVLDPVLKRGRPRTDRNGQPLIFSGGFTSVFVIDCRDKAYALRCWISDIGDAAHRYQVIGDCLDQVHLPWFVDFAYESEGILVNGKRYPTLRMEWVDTVAARLYRKVPTPAPSAHARSRELSGHGTNATQAEDRPR
jgi:hypothetical protein